MPIHNQTPMILLLAGMMAVTYVPRLIPFFMIRNLRLQPRLKRFLELIPFTAIGALVLPGLFSSVPGHPAAMLLGISFAIIWSWFKGGMMVPVSGAIAMVYLVLTLS